MGCECKGCEMLVAELVRLAEKLAGSMSAKNMLENRVRWAEAEADRLRTELGQVTGNEMAADGMTNSYGREPGMPSWAKWIAWDADGECFIHEEEPEYLDSDKLFDAVDGGNAHYGVLDNTFRKLKLRIVP
jgi:hypothetical protein